MENLNTQVRVFKKLVSKLTELLAIVLEKSLHAEKHALRNTRKVSVFEGIKNVCVENGENMTLLIGVLYEYLNESIGREETTLHRLDVSKKISTNHYMKEILQF